MEMQEDCNLPYAFEKQARFPLIVLLIKQLLLTQVPLQPKKRKLIFLIVVSVIPYHLINCPRMTVEVTAIGLKKSTFCKSHLCFVSFPLI